MDGSQRALFDKHLPTFSDDQARNFHAGHGGDVVSVAGRFGAPKNFVVAFATQTEKFGPIALNLYSARVLLNQLAEFCQRYPGTGA